tara:strand:- start:3691 stop:3861 length:171 start_codon:yes stop_codon:yes gene_type:complete
MDKERLLELLEEIDDILTDAYNTGHEGEINSDSLYYIDAAQGKLEDLTIKINKEDE